jgi:Xaa-Pro aminopeptidase
VAIHQFDEVNVAGLRDLLDANQLDGVVCRAGVNVTYLSGLSTPGTLGRHLDLAETPRATFVIWPAAGEPVLVISEIASDVARGTSWISQLETYPDYLTSPEECLAGVITRLGLGGARIGFDMAWFGAGRWAVLRRLLPAVDAIDVTDGMDRIRAVKTPAEVEHLGSAANLLDQCMSDVFPTIRAGETERAVHARIVARAIELGAESIHGILQSSSNRVLYGGESDVRLEEGSLVRTDYVLYLDGYAANLSRPVHVGRPSAETLDRYRAYVSVCREVVAVLRPGRAGGEIHRSIQEAFSSAGLEQGPAISGHGIGRWFHQQYPLCVPGSSDVLEPGMVIALEPISGHWHLQDEFLITESDPIRISDRFDWGELPWTA